MLEPDYFATFYNEEKYSLQQKDRKAGSYSTQWCEVEMKLGDIEERP